MNTLPLNIVLLTIDCLRADHVARATPSASSLTPHLDQLAAESVVFSNAFTCGGWTLLAMTALFSSTYASMYGGVFGKYAAERPMLSEVLQENGYDTGAFNSHYVICGRKAGFDRGFTTYVDLKPDEQPPWQKKIHRHPLFGHLMSYQPVHAGLSLIDKAIMPPDHLVTADKLTEHAISWLEQPRSQPFFLWGHYMDIHWPYRASRRAHTPTELREAWRDRPLYRQLYPSSGGIDPGVARRTRWETLYREELMTLDEQLGRLINYLRGRDDWERTVIIVTGDHGEEFYEHGTYGHGWNQLFDEGTHVPLIMRLPQAINEQKYTPPVSHLDLAPTILNLAKIPKPATMRGSSLLPRLSAKSVDQKESQSEVYTEMMAHYLSRTYRLAIRTDTHKYIYDIEQPHDVQLYNLVTDPNEMHNLRDEQPELLRHFDKLRLKHVSLGLLGLIKNRNNPLQHGHDLSESKEDPDLLERLQALGYL